MDSDQPIKNKMLKDLYNKLFYPYEKAWIQTYTGKKFYPINPNPDDIDIKDIAHALSQICRFSGHSTEFYSVAQHSVYVSQWCSEQDALFGLIHDCSEAYIGDISSPLKRTPLYSKYRNMESKLQNMIYSKYCCSEVEPESVKIADIRVFETECRDVIKTLHKHWTKRAEPLPFTITPLPPKEAEKLFLDRFEELYEKK